MRRSIRYLVGFGAFFWLVTTARAQDVLMEHNDKARTGANLREMILNAKSVGPKFGKLWNFYADGQVVTQPLYVSGLRIDTATNRNIPRVQGTFNALVVTTMHNTIYVYDADRENRGPEGRTVPLWATWLGPPRPGGKDIDMWSTNDPEWGILSTPVISEDKSTLYVVAWHDEGTNGFQYRLHALNLKDGADRDPPAAIGPASKDASNPCQKQNIFNPCAHKQRAGLLLDRGVLYIGFGGDGNRGALFAFDAASLVQRAFWSSTPTGQDGGIWQSGQAPAVDSLGNIYLMTGNGTFDPDKQNFGNSFVKLKLEGNSFLVKDYFTPCNVNALNGKDLDLGSAGPMLVPNEPARILGGGKEGVLYVLSPANLRGTLRHPIVATQTSSSKSARFRRCTGTGAISMDRPYFGRARTPGMSMLGAKTARSRHTNSVADNCKTLIHRSRAGIDLPSECLAACSRCLRTAPKPARVCFGLSFPLTEMPISNAE
jgi:hypothetical protein